MLTQLYKLFVLNMGKSSSPSMECKLPLSLPPTYLYLCEFLIDSVLIRTTIRTAQVSLNWMVLLPTVLSGHASVASTRNSFEQKKHWKTTMTQPTTS